MKSIEVHLSTRKGREYKQGVSAFMTRKEIRHCPYEKGDRRLSWFTGYYDARTRQRLAHIFDKYELSWP